MIRLAACILVAIATLASAAALAAAELRIGAAETDITPPIGYPMAGYYHERLATGARDPLKAKAIVFKEGDEQAAVVVCDLTGISYDLTLAVRKLASEKTGIPPEKITLSGTHSHTAPAYYGDLYRHLGDEAQKKQATEYPGQLIASIAEAIEKANAACAPASVHLGSAAQETPIAFNRRFVTRDGSVRTWLSLDNPDVVRPAGPIDPEVGVALIRSSEGDKPLAALSNFALHLDTLGGMLWSADYPHYVERAVRASLGEEAISIFGNGCCGDINHVDPSRKERNNTELIGTALGATVVSTFDTLRPIAAPKLTVRTAIAPLPLQPVSPDEIPRALALLEAAKRGEKVDFFEQVTAYKQVMIDHYLRKAEATTEGPAAAVLIGSGLSHAWGGVGESLPVEVQVIGIGRELAIVFLPGEVFVDLGLAIKQNSPFEQTMIIELSNAVETHYIPTRAAYAGGSYEVTNSTVQAGSGEILVETALRLLREAASSN
jgi:neutral ceramidase